MPSESCFADFDQFLAAGINVCHIASPHTAHVEQALRCLSAGVSVLVEKPLALTRADAERVYRVARENGLFAMEALWTRFIPAMEAVCSRIQAGDIGNLISIDTDFGFDGANAPARLTDPALGGGSLFDLASYALHLPPLLLPDDKKVLPPTILHTESKTRGNGVDDSFRAVLCYSSRKSSVTRQQWNDFYQLLHSNSRGEPLSISQEENVLLLFRTSILENTSQTAIIRGSLGTCIIEAPFWCPQSFWMNGKNESVEKIGHGLHYQVREVERCMRLGMLESKRVSWDESTSWAGVMETLGGLR